MKTPPLALTALSFAAVVALLPFAAAAEPAAAEPTAAEPTAAEPAAAEPAAAEPAAAEPAPALPDETAPTLPDETPPGELPEESPPPPAPPAPPTPSATPAPTDTLYYPEEAAGQSTLTLGYGVGGWFTDRGPLADLALTAPVIGYDHRIGPARLGWRAHLYLDPTGDAPLTFVYADLLSIEYVFAQGTLRPYTRLALGFGLDLADADIEIDGKNPGLGDDGYFNEANGPTGGPGLTLGAGLDAFFTDRAFIRIEALARGYGGVGAASAMWGTSLALGLVL